MTSLFPPRESLVVTSRLGTGNSRTFFLRCSWSPYVSQSCFVSFRWHLKGSNLPSVPTLAAPPSYPPLRVGSSHPNHPPPPKLHPLWSPPALSLPSIPSCPPPLPTPNFTPTPWITYLFFLFFSHFTLSSLSRIALSLFAGHPSRARICKRLRSPGIYSKESIPPAYMWHCESIFRTGWQAT